MYSKGQTGLYFHWPFCLAKCPYCDFNVHVREHIAHERWEKAYIKALEHYAQKLGPRIIGSIFFGGGTPSLMNPDTVERIISHARTLFPFTNDPEITLEANPTSIENGRLQAFKNAGINRVSIGVQALSDHDLKFLGRKHNAAEARRALETAASLFPRYSFDLIYARPEQTLQSWSCELKQALEFSPSHLSLYQLTIERSTPFYFEAQQGHFRMPGEDHAAALYLETQEIMEEAGLPAYEISNHAREGEESRHNLIYWNYGDYIGIGPGAHGRLTLGLEKFATRGHHAPEIWLERVEQAGEGTHPYQSLSAKDRFLEALMMGLRLRAGIAFSDLEQNSGRCWRDFMDMDHLRIAQEQGWLNFDEHRLWLGVEGQLRLNSLVPYITAALSEPPEQERLAAAD